MGAGDYVPNDVLAGTTRLQFLDDVMPHHENAWGDYHIPTGQQNNVLAQLSLLYIQVRCIVEPNHDKNCEEMVRWCGVYLAWMPH